MFQVPSYNPEGELVGHVEVDPAIFGVEINLQLMHEVVLMHEARSRVGTVNTRGRSDVAGSTKKIFRQKGTGNARAGSKRTNKRVGGGVAFARRNRDYSYSLPKRSIRSAIRMAIKSKFLDNQVVLIEDLSLEAPKTSTVARLLAAIPKPDLGEDEKLGDGATVREHRERTLAGGTALIGLARHDPMLFRSARNIARVAIAPVPEFNTRDVLKFRYLVLTRSGFDSLKQRMEEPVNRRVAVAV